MERESDGKDELMVGVVFASKHECILWLKSYAIKRRFEFRVEFSDTKRYRIKCSTSQCGWFIHTPTVVKGASHLRSKVLAPIIAAELYPLCNRTLPSYAARAGWVQSVIEEKVRDTPSYCSNETIADIHREFDVEVDYKTAWRALTASKDVATEAWDVSFQLLLAYLQNLKLANPGTQTQLLVDDAKRFLTLFISFESCRNAVRSCRPVFGLDGAFLKGKCMGTLLVVTAIDAEGSIFPLAIGVARNECEGAWRRFLEQLHACVTPRDSACQCIITFLTDRQKGLINAVGDIFPLSYHGFCLRHLEANVRATLTLKRKVIELMWKAAREPTVPKFNDAIDQIKAIGPVVTGYLLESAAHWATVLFEGERYGQLTSNIAESLNAWRLEAREMPVVSMCEKARTQCMQLFTSRKAVGRKMAAELVPHIHAKVEDCKERARKYRIIQASTTEFEVYTIKHQRAVDLGTKICSYSNWQQLRHPCSHVAAALMCIGASLVDATSKHLLAATYRATYAINIHPLLGRDEWVEVEDLPLVLPPPTQRPP